MEQNCLQDELYEEIKCMDSYRRRGRTAAHARLLPASGSSWNERGDPAAPWSLSAPASAPVAPHREGQTSFKNKSAPHSHCVETDQKIFIFFINHYMFIQLINNTLNQPPDLKLDPRLLFRLRTKGDHVLGINVVAIYHIRFIIIVIRNTSSVNVYTLEFTYYIYEVGKALFKLT